MDTVMSQQKLEEMLDQAVRKVAEQTAGIQLHQSGQSLSEDLCTIHITFNRGFQTSLSLCADNALMARMARTAFGVESPTNQDLEDFAKEYCNILCGKIAAFLFRTTRVAARFSVPAYYEGRYEPKNFNTQFKLNYSDDQRDSAQLIHYIPCFREHEALPEAT